MGEKASNQNNDIFEDDALSINDIDNEKIAIETDRESNSETTLMQDLIKASGLAFLRSKRRDKQQSDSFNQIGNEQLAPIIIFEEDPTNTANQESWPTENEIEVQVDTEKNVATKKTRLKIRIIIIIFLVIAAYFMYQTVPLLLEPNPPSQEVVATYNNKMITVDQLMEFIQLEGVKDNEHGICEKHGFDHSKCDDLEECETHPVHSLASYQQISRMMAVETIIDDWAAKNGITQRNDVEHGLKDLIKDINLDSLIGQIHEKELSPDSIPKWEVQQYFDENKGTFNGKAFTDVEAEIRNILVSQKDENYFPEYIEKLKQSAGLNVNFEILKVTDPTEQEMQNYYTENSKDFITKAKVNILEIKIDKKDKANDGLSIANEALSKLRAGENFDSVVLKYAIAGKSSTASVFQGERGEVFDKAVFNLRENDFSEAYEFAGEVYLAKLLSKENEKQKTYGTVKQEIKEILLKEKASAQYNIHKDEALFTVHSKRYTLGEFAIEFEELPVEYQIEFAGYEGKKRLVEQMIAKELLLEEYNDETESAEDKHKIEDIRRQYLSQILHKEEIDGKLGEISDTEAEAFYKKNQDKLIEPAKLKLSIIWIDEGANGEKAEQAKAKANEALTAIKNGMDFSEIAKQYSEDASAAVGGVINDWIYEAHLPVDFAKSIFSLGVNAVSQVIRSQGGVYIVKILEKEELRKKSFEEVKDAVKNHLSDEKHLEMEANLEKELLEKSKLIVYDKTLRALVKANQSK